MAKYRLQIELNVTCKKIDPERLEQLILDEWYLGQSGSGTLCDMRDSGDPTFEWPVRYSPASIRVKEIK